MQLPGKQSECNNIHYKNKYTALGILGGFIILYGTTQKSPQYYYVIAAFALLSTAVHYRMLYYIALELILIAGHAAIIFGSGPYTQLALPVLLCVQLLIFYLMFGKENNIFLLFGICGIALLSIGFAYSQRCVFFIGSTFIAIYSYYSGYKGRYPAYIWAILNTILSCLSLYKLLFVLPY